jgi:antitoxin (DNA-binding transcriptional repressor) of toxin-antitoxin stability system
MSTMSVSDARATLTHVIDRVVAGEEVTLTRHGQPVAVLIRPDLLPSRRGAAFEMADHVRALLDEGRRTALSRSGALSAEEADALLDDVRVARVPR